MSTTEQRQANNRRNKRERDKRAVIAGRKPQRDAAYLEWIRSLPCVCCFLAWGIRKNTQAGYIDVIRHAWELPEEYRTMSEVAHVGTRGLRQKSSDRETIPLCAGCHREGPHSHHRIGRRFWKHHGIDRDELIAALNQAYEERAA